MKQEAMLDLLADIDRPPIDVLRDFERASRRLQPLARGMLLGIGATIRAERQRRRAQDEAAISRWADDGGRA